MSYNDLLLKYKDDLEIKIIKAINNTTLSTSYSIYTNLHVDVGIVDADEVNHFHSHSKSKFNRAVLKFKRLYNTNPVLIGTNNDASYTRLIYSFKRKNVNKK